MTQTTWYKRKKGVIIAAIIAFLGILWLVFTSQPAQHATSKHLSLSAYLKTKWEEHVAASLPWQTVIVQPGDTLSHIFSHLGIKAADLQRLVKSPEHPLHLLQPGEKLAFQVNPQHELVGMSVPIDSANTLLLKRAGSAFKATTLHKRTSTTLAFKSGTIEHSLSGAAARAGLSSAMFAQLQNIFAGTVNFNRDVRRGDSFALLYEVHYIDGKPYHSGNIVAADFTNRGKTYRAIRYTYPKDHSGYYTPDGHNVESRFLTTPVKYKRVSSHFSYRRLDPYTHKVHSHLGVDLAAYYGTPIKSIGDGIVTFKGPDAGYGNAVKIRYGTHYQTLYAHMSRFAKDLKVHQHVKKGQVIGYVGATGWATGPHLHFGIFVDGVPKDWLKLKPPKGEPIPSSYKARFAETSKTLLATLTLREETQTELAANASKTHAE